MLIVGVYVQCGTKISIWNPASRTLNSATVGEFFFLSYLVFLFWGGGRGRGGLGMRLTYVCV